MNKLFQNSYFCHDITPIVFYNVCDELDMLKGEQYYDRYQNSHHRR